MAGLVAGIHVLGSKKDVDARDKRGHDEHGSPDERSDIREST